MSPRQEEQTVSIHGPVRHLLIGGNSEQTFYFYFSSSELSNQWRLHPSDVLNYKARHRQKQANVFCQHRLGNIKDKEINIHQRASAEPLLQPSYKNCHREKFHKFVSRERNLFISSCVNSEISEVRRTRRIKAFWLEFHRGAAGRHREMTDRGG